MAIADPVTTCLDQSLSRAILVALATHEDIRIKDLASGYSDAEIGAIALATPPELLIIIRMAIDEVLGEISCPNDKSDSPDRTALATQLRQVLIAKRVLNVSMATRA